MDWVPGHVYGTTQTVEPQTQVNVPLIDPLVWASSTETVGRIEDQAAFQLLRVVGYFEFWWSEDGGPGNGRVMHRLQPCFQDQDLGVPIAPGIMGDPVGQAEVANEKFWWERRHAGADFTTTDRDFWSLFYHPWQIFCDAKIRQWIPDNMVPCWCIYNDDQTTPLFARHYFRLLTGRTAGA